MTARHRPARILTVWFWLVALVALAAAPALADGTETLGTPSIPVASGSGTVAAGVGLVGGPATININVPGTVRQALLYWEGHSAGAVYDDRVKVNGTEVVGTVIGGPTNFFGSTYSTTLRADITSMVSPGANALLVSDMNFTRFNNGAGVLVIYDDGTSADIQLRDGNDLAFHSYAPPLNTTVPQTFTFAAEPIDRVATMSIFASSVSTDPAVPGLRPTIIRVTTGATVTDFNNQLDGVDGDQWDTLVVNITVPAGATSLTVQALSADANATGQRPASFAWNVGALSVPVTPPPPPPPPGGGEGCTPGYWRQPHHFWAWTGYAPTDNYATVFGVNSSFTLSLQGAVTQGGGGEKALGRHAVAALLNSTSAGVDYQYTTAEVIALVQGAYVSGNFETAKNLLETANEKGCPLGNPGTEPAEADPAPPAGPPAGGPPAVPPGLAKNGKGPKG